MPRKKTTPTSVTVHGTKSASADKPTREVRWNVRRKAIVQALRQLKAFDNMTARTAEEIAVIAAKKGAPELKDDTEYNGRQAKGVYLVKVALDIYRVNELTHNGITSQCNHEGERALRYFLTEQGKVCEMEIPEKKEKPDNRKSPPAAKKKPGAKKKPVKKSPVKRRAKTTA